MPILSREEMTTGYYIRLNAEDQTGVLADVTTILSRAESVLMPSCNNLA